MSSTFKVQNTGALETPLVTVRAGYTASANIEDTQSENSFPTTLESYEPLPCYNLFLKTNNLPLLPQTNHSNHFLITSKLLTITTLLKY